MSRQAARLKLCDIELYACASPLSQTTSHRFKPPVRIAFEIYGSDCCDLVIDVYCQSHSHLAGFVRSALSRSSLSCSALRSWLRDIALCFRDNPVACYIQQVALDR